MLAGMPLEDFHVVAPTVLHVIGDKDPTYHSYHSPGGPVGAGISLLADLSIEEGIQYTLDVLDMPSGKWGFKLRMVFGTLPKYGANAKDALAKLKSDPRINPERLGRFTGLWTNMVKAIEEDKDARELISLQEAIKAGKKK